MREGLSSTIVVVYDGTQATDTNRVKIYVDGRLQTLTFTAGTVSPTLPVGTGHFYIGKLGTGASNPLDSYVTFAALWPTALNALQVLDATIW
jgi:hypothetical protein